MDWTEERVADLKRLWAERNSMGKIAEEFGCTRGAVSGKIDRLKLPKRGHAPSGGPHRRKSERDPKYRVPVRRVPHFISTGNGGMRVAMANDFKFEPVREFDAADIPPEQRKTFLELRSNDCRWPYGDPHLPDFFFCGAPKVDGSSYCAMHARIAFNPSGYRNVSDDEHRRRSASFKRAFSPKIAR